MSGTIPSSLNREFIAREEALRAIDEILLPEDIPGGYVGPDSTAHGLELARKAIRELIAADVTQPLTLTEEMRVVDGLSRGELTFGPNGDLTLSDIMTAAGAAPGPAL